MFEIKKKWKSPPPPPPPYEGATVLMRFELIGNNKGKDLVTGSVPEVGNLNFIKGVCEAKVPVEMAADFPSRCPYGFWFVAIEGRGAVTPAKEVAAPDPVPTPEPEEDLLRYRELNAKLNITKEALKALVDAGKVTVTKKTQGNNELKYYSVKEVKAAMEVNHEG